MTFTNKEIFDYALTLQSCFYVNNMNQMRFIKAKVNFYLQKNITLLLNLGKEIEEMRDQILSQYGERDKENDSWKIRPECIHLANQELNSLMNLKQDVKIYQLALSELLDLDFTSQEMRAILFMINDDLNEEE